MPSGDVLVLIDDSGRVVEWGRPAEELFGWSAEEAVGRSVAALMREVAADGESRRERFSDAAAVLVKPVLRGTSVVWQVLSAGDTMSGQDVAILKAMFTHSPVVLHVLDDQLRVVRMSTATGELNNTPVGHLLGKRFTEAWELEDPEEEAAVAQRVMETGEPVVNRLVRHVKAPGRPTRRIQSFSYFRLEDSRPCARTGGIRRRRHRARERAEPPGPPGHGPQTSGAPAERGRCLSGAGGGGSARLRRHRRRRSDRRRHPRRRAPPVPVPGDVPLRRTAFQGRIAVQPVGVVRPLPTGTPSRTSCPTFGPASYRSRRTARGWPPTRPEPKSSGGPVHTP